MGSCECGHDGGPCLAGANACTRRLNLVSPLAGEPNDVSEAQGRRQHRGRLCRRGGRPGRGPHRQEKSESKTRETVHDVTVCLMRFPPGQRKRRPGRKRQPLPADAGELLVHLGSGGRFLGRIPRQT